MHTFNTAVLFALARSLESEIGRPDQPGDGDELAKEDRRSLLAIVEPLIEDCKNHDFRCSLATLKKIRHAINVKGGSRSVLQPLWHEFAGRLQDELETTLFLALSALEAALFIQNEPVFGTTVHQRFPEASKEVMEAGRCLALGRGTACVFHTLRGLERGLIALHRAVGAPDPAKSTRSWSKYLELMRSEIEKKKGTALETFSERAWAMLDSINRAWRNPTMHVESTYSAEEAHEVFVLLTEIIHATSCITD